jgi:hypothetical protein
MKGPGLLLALLFASALSAQTERTVTILAIADWKGDLAVDQKGRGGLATFLALKRRIEQKIAPRGGSVIAVHAGQFTQATLSTALEDSLKRPDPGLIQYVGFTALTFSKQERALLEKTSLDLPIVERECTPKAKCKTEIVTSNSTLKWWITGLDPLKDRKSDTLLRDLESSAHKADADFSILLLSEPQTETIFAGQTGNVHSAVGDLGRFLVIESGKKNLFYRDPAGPYVCVVAGRSICRVDLTFRGSLIGVSQKFIDPNGASEPGEFIKPDPVLMDQFFRP